MSDIKSDVKETVKAFIQTLVSVLVREATKTIIKNLTERQKKRFEDKIKDMSDDQLGQYLDENPYFKNTLENALRSLSSTQSAKETVSLMEKLQSVYEGTPIKKPISAFIWPAPKIIFVTVVGVALLATIAVQAFSENPDNNTSLLDNNSTFLGNNTTLAKLPVANFTINVTNGSSPLTIQFSDLSENAKERSWDFGDGNNSKELNPVHTYFTKGNYTVNLTAINGTKTNSAIATITVLEMPVQPILEGSMSGPSKPAEPLDSGESTLPVANFSTNITSGYAPLTVQFNDSSQNSTSWSWDFGDGQISSAQDPINTYYSAGTYTVSLTASNINGTNSKTVAINVTNVPAQPILPVANFSANVTNGGAPLSVQFNDNSKNVTGWNWDFGDGMNSTEQNPTHTYLAAGYFKVNLTVNNSIGTASKFATITVSQPVLPVAKFSSNVTKGFTPLSVLFTDQSENAAGWYWDFGDGTYSTEQSPAHTYPAAGNYTVNLTAMNINGTASRNSTIAAFPVYVYVTNSGDDTVSLINTTTKSATLLSVGTNPYGVAVIPDGTLYVANEGYETDLTGSISVIDTATKTVAPSLPVGRWASGVVANPAGTRIYLTSEGSDSVSIINTTTNNVTATVKVGYYLSGIAVSPDGRKVYVANSGYNGNVSVIDTGTNTIITNVSGFKYPNGVAVTPDGKEVYVTSYGEYPDYEGAVSVIDTGTNTIITNVSGFKYPNGVAVTPDGKEVYVTSYGEYPDYEGNVSVIDTVTNTIITNVNGLRKPTEIAVTPDGKEVYVVNEDNDTVSVIDTSTKTVTAFVTVGTYPRGITTIQGY